MNDVPSLRTLPLALAAAGALLVGCGPETASSTQASLQMAPPVQAAGTFAIQLTPTAVTAADGNTFIDATFHEVLTGFFDGTRDGSGRLVTHADGTFEGMDCGTFTGVVGGVQSGSVEICITAQGAGASLMGRFVVRGGAGNLAGIQGAGGFQGTATGPLAFSGSYSGQVVFPQ